MKEISVRMLDRAQVHCAPCNILPMLQHLTTRRGIPEHLKAPPNRSEVTGSAGTMSSHQTNARHVIHNHTKDAHHLLGGHAHRLDREFAPTHVKEVFQIWT